MNRFLKKILFSRRRAAFLPALLILALFSCNVTKRLPEGEHLYTGAKIEINTREKSVSTSELKTAAKLALQPRPNSRFLGVFPIRLWFNQTFATTKQKGLRHWLAHKIGQEPVLYDETVSENVANLISNRAYNLGFFRNKVTFEEDFKKKKVKVNYIVTVGEPYSMDTLMVEAETPGIDSILEDNLERSYIKPGNNYDLGELKLERERLSGILNDSGYYYLAAPDLEFLADTSGNDRGARLLLHLKNDTPERSRKRQWIESITVVQDYDPESLETAPRDTVFQDGVDIVCEQCALKPFAIRYAILQKPNELYSAEEHRKTLKRITNLNTYRYINVEYEPFQGSDTLLAMRVLLTPRLRRTITGEVGISFSDNDFFGPEAGLTYWNRNLFRGAEFFKLEANTRLSYFTGSGRTVEFPFYSETKLLGTLSFPRLWLPLRDKQFSNLQYGNTHFKGGLELENLRYQLQSAEGDLADHGYSSVNDFLAEFGLTTLEEKVQQDSAYAPFILHSEASFRYGYNWQGRSIFRHELNPVGLRLQNSNFEEEELFTFIQIFLVLEEEEEDAIQSLLSLERMVSINPDYILSFDTRLNERPGKLNWYLRQRWGFSGNFVFPSASLLESASLQSQSIQWETDVRQYWRYGLQNELALRFRGFVTTPISQSSFLPYFDLYSIGGPNSLRGFAPRTVGPGSSEQKDLDIVFAGFGSTLLEGNIEQRFLVGQVFEPALFFDMGNVWRHDTSQDPKANFDLTRFYNELAMDGGVGLRFNFNFLLVRFDLAVALRKPWLPEGERWVWLEGNQRWFWENLRFNFAFGYPF